jgi:dihydrodipicolinate synthase/N-acetylneuraminate lyase
MRTLGVAGIKYGCDLNGYFGGAPRLPRLPLNAEQREQVDEALRELRN